MPKQLKSKRGFTIIEVVLVLAIAGLIFLMVFLALPALQRSQRDTQRQDDIARLQAALINYQTNNRGKIPTTLTGASATGATTSTTGTIDGSKITGSEYDGTAVKSGSWAYFYAKYLLIADNQNGNGTTDTFMDPDNISYGLYVVYCSDAGTDSKPQGSLKTGEDCQGKAQRNDINWSDQADGSSGDTDYGAQYTVSVVLGATCDGELAVASTGRKVAFVYKKEGGGTICLTN